jgi:serine/threonine protein kinase
VELQAIPIAICSVCQVPLGANGECLACLLRGGLGQIETNGSTESLRFGDFEIARRVDGSLWELGSGAMGVTYRAVDKVLHRTVALKVVEIPTVVGKSAAVRERFLREARAAAALKHPNVAGIFQFGASLENDRCYYAMELVEGETLEALVRREGPLSVELALEIAIQVTRALIGAAAQGLIHRDLKPGNIMLAGTDSAAAEMEVKVIDFGLAKITNAVGETDLTHGGFVGTPSFASPEQFGNRPADSRSDIYSLGVTLWYALTGEVPYPGKTIDEIRDRQQRTDLPLEQLVERGISGPVIDVLQRTLALEPIRRPASAKDLLGDLEACRATVTSPKAAGSARPRRKLAPLVGTLVIVAAIPLALLMLRQKTPVIASAGIPIAEKSIAVLPFENLDKDETNAFFAAGVQDEILSDLAKIADLKVISRTSVMKYKSGAQRNLREIGRELGVAHVLEGSVQRVGDRIRVNAQLIDAGTDTHLWAETYDRDSSDVFIIQSEIADQIARQLQAKISPQEKAAIAEKPTSDLTAYAFYNQARTLENAERNYEKRVKLLREAIRLDPNFILAYCLLAKLHTDHYNNGNFSFEADRIATAAQSKEIIDTALRLRPDRLRSRNWRFSPECHRMSPMAISVSIQPGIRCAAIHVSTPLSRR